MRPRFFAPFAVVAAAPLLLVSARAQTPKAAQPSTTPQAASPQAAKPPAASKWTPPRTPWGDPDLQGWYTNLSEDGTPLERPDQFAGRKLEDIQGAELAKIKEDIQKRTITNFQGPLHAPEHWWQDDLNLVKGSQAWWSWTRRTAKFPR